MREIVTTAKTTDEAIEIALKELDADRAEVEIDVVSRGKTGILGIGGQPARVRVTLLEKADDVVTVVSDILGNLISKLGVSAVANLKQVQKQQKCAAQRRRQEPGHCGISGQGPYHRPYPGEQILGGGFARARP